MLKRAAKIAVFAAIIGPVFYLLIEHLNEMDRAQIASSMRAIPLQAIAISGLFTAISLYGVARYDLLAIKQLGYQVPQKRAIQGGFVAVSLGQTLGFGLLVGAFARWRFYRSFGVSLKDAGLVSALVAGGFLIGFALILSVTALIDPSGLSTMTGAETGFVRIIAACGLLAFLGLVGLSFTQVGCTAFGLSLRAPKIKVLCSQVMLAAVDVIPAAAALWILLPAEGGPSLMLVIPVFLTALGVGLVSNTPGGLGVLELACLMALPVMPPEQLVAALITYRAIYFGLPAVIAVAMLVAREVFARDRSDRDITSRVTKSEHIIPQAVLRILETSARADANLALLGDKRFVVSDCGRGFIMYRISGNSLVALGDPVGDPAVWTRLVAKLERVAQQKMLVLSFYKIGAEFGRWLASKGRTTTHIASDAIVDVTAFSLEGSSKRELRRKLKSAAKASVEIICHAPGEAPLLHYERINQAWSAAKGGERGFSMGKFDHDYLCKFICLEAKAGAKPLGFMSLWQSGDGTEWSLDVMRLLDDAPDGTMHALVAQAIELAKAAGAARFSLCAVPLAGVEAPRNALERIVSYVYTAKPNWHGSTGLYRFKNAFRPEWTPVYGAAPGYLASALAALDVFKLVQPVKAVENTPEIELETLPELGEAAA